MANAGKITTPFTEMFKCKYPIIAGPMFLVSNEEMVAGVSNAGAVGGAPSLNWRTAKQFEDAIKRIQDKTQNTYAINIIVSKANPRVDADIDVCVKMKVPMLITSLGNPGAVIKAVHGYGGKVFCDVVDLKYATKVEAQGCDGVIAVSTGAGGHPGPLTSMVLVPYLKSKLKIPVVLAGGIATGRQIAAALLLGADAVQIGTRFIASSEAPVTKEYKDAVVNSEPEDIVLSRRISGTPASVIKTPYVEKEGLDLNPLEKLLFKNEVTKKYIRMLTAVVGQKALEKAAKQTTWKTVWSAGQGVGLIHDIKPVAQIVEDLVSEYWEAVDSLPRKSN